MTSFKTIAAAETRKIHLLDVQEQPLYFGDDPGRPIKVTIYGPGSREYQQAKSAQENRAVARLQRRAKEMSVEEKAAAKAQFLADITRDWEHMAFDEFAGLTGRDLSIAVYSEPSIAFIADQVHREVHDWANFSQKSAAG